MLGAPQSVNPQLLQPNGSLLSDQQKQRIKTYFDQNPTVSLFKGDNDIPFPVVRTAQNELMVLYVSPQEFMLPPEKLPELKKEIKDKKDQNPQGVYPLGIGRDGIVVAAQSLDSNSWCAAKFETFHGIAASSRLESIEMEQSALKTQNDVFKGSATIEHQTPENPLTTVMTAMKIGPGKDLNEAMVDDNGVNILTLEQKLAIAFKVTQATADLSKQNIVHRDFKPNNIMADPTTQEVMLIDFGGAGRLDENDEFVEDEFIGTAGYDAPELTTGALGIERKRQSEHTMAFSLGISLAEIFTKNNVTQTKQDWKQDYINAPLPSMSHSQILGCFSDVLGDTPEIKGKQNIIESAMSEVVRKLIQVDPNQRINAQLAANELSIIKEYHELLVQHNVSLDKANSTSLLEHMAMVKLMNPSNTALMNGIGALEGRLNHGYKAQQNHVVSLLEKRLSRYLDNPNPADVNVPGFKQHMAQMNQYLSDLRKLDSQSPTFKAQFAVLREKIAAQKTLFEINRFYNHLKTEAKTLNKLAGKEQCSDLNKQLKEFEQLYSNHRLTSSELRKLSDKLSEVYKAYSNARVKSNENVKKDTQKPLAALKSTEKQLTIYRNLQNQITPTGVVVKEKKENPVIRQIKSWRSAVRDLFRNPQKQTQVAKASVGNQQPPIAQTKPQDMPTATVVPIPQRMPPTNTATQQPMPSTVPPISPRALSKIVFLANYIDHSKSLSQNPFGAQALQNLQSDLNTYRSDSDPFVKLLAEAIHAKVQGNNVLFAQKLVEFKANVVNQYGTIANLDPKVDAKLGKLEQPSQLIFTPLRTSTQTNLRDEQLASCRKDVSDLLVLQNGMDNIEKSYASTGRSVVEFIQQTLSAKGHTLKTIEDLHNQTKHVWKDEAKSPLAVLINEIKTSNKEVKENAVSIKPRK
ncbi:MAG: protein kinase [Candidatus Berkiella sp.]